jgi:putative Mg2+ transporter-C (MgtC) family protein
MNAQLVALGEPTGQGWSQIGELGAALVLSSLIGLERQLRQKSAGLRTHTLVGLGAALFMLISKYGFTDVLVSGQVVLDPSRVAAQIVSGIGFIGGGLIFVRRDIVRGLTTAAVVWVSAAVGAACGAGLPLLAAVVTAAHFLVLYGYPPLVRLVTGMSATSAVIRIRYRDGHGVLRNVLRAAGRLRFSVLDVQIDHEEDDQRRGDVELSLRVVGARPATELVTELSELDNVRSVAVDEPGE